MLTLNMTVRSHVTIGDSVVQLTSVEDPTIENGNIARAVFRINSHTSTFKLPTGTSGQILPNVILHVFKVMIGNQVMVRIGIDAPRHIKIENSTGRPVRVTLSNLSDDELVSHGRKWAKTALEDELLNRLENI